MISFQNDDRDISPGFHPDDQTARCRNLWAYCFMQGVEEYIHAVRVGESRHHPSIRWLESRWTGTGSIIWLCTLFHLDPERVRNEIRKRSTEKK